MPHLTEDHGGLVDNSRFCHLVVEVVAFTGTLAYTGENGVSAVLCCDVTDELLNEDGLTYAGTSEESDLTALLVGAEEVYDLDTGLEEFAFGGLFLEGGSRSVDGLVRYAFGCGLIVDGLSKDVEYSSEGIFSDGDRDGSAC